MEYSVRWAFNTRSWRPTATEWSAALSLVQAEEKERITKFMFRRDAKSALVGRLLLRKLAAEVIGVPWGMARFERTAHGRPCLVGEQRTRPEVDFNVSHQGGWAVLASESGVSVGVDVMELKPPPGRPISAFLTSMSRQFTKEEWKYVDQSHDDSKRLNAFYRLWCLKESVIKAKGDGLTYSLTRLSLTPGDPSPAPLPAPVTLSTTLAIDGTLDPSWYFEESMLDPFHPVAVALNPVTVTPATLTTVAPTPVTRTPVAPTPTTLTPVSHTPVTPTLATVTPVTHTPISHTPVTLNPVTRTLPKHFTQLTYHDLTSSAVPLTSLDLAAGDAFIAKSEEP